MGTRMAVAAALMSLALIAVPLVSRAKDEASEPVPTGSIKGALKSPYTRLAEGAVYIVEVKDGKFDPPEKHPVMDQKNKIFTPHILPVLVGTTVDFANTDDVKHSVYARKGSAADFNLGQYDVGVVKQVKFETVGATHLGCNVHAEMSGYVVVCQNPYFAIADKKGAFHIQGVPPGRYQLTFFHEQIQATTLEVTVEADRETVAEFTGLKRKS